MASIRFRSFLVVLLPAAMLVAGPAPDRSQGDWGLVLEQFVDKRGMVDYRGLRDDREALDRYLGDVADVGPKAQPQRFPTADHRLAYYVNAYNALVFAAVLDLGPGADSVWGFTGTGLRFFVLDKHRLDGEAISLKRLEDELVREQFQDPRVHAALNCASRGCPRLPQEPFSAETLDAQLEAAMTEFVGEGRNVRYDAETNTVYLSKIFDWFRSDFEDWEARQPGSDGELLTYVNRYRAPDARVPADARIRFADYDKLLNRQ